MNIPASPVSSEPAPSVTESRATSSQTTSHYAGDVASSSTESISGALQALNSSLSKLDSAVDRHLETRKSADRLDLEMQQLIADRSNLAQKVDATQARANRLDDVNQEVSRRLVNAMETVRSVLNGNVETASSAGTENQQD